MSERFALFVITGVYRGERGKAGVYLGRADRKQEEADIKHPHVRGKADYAQGGDGHEDTLKRHAFGTDDVRFAAHVSTLHEHENEPDKDEHRGIAAFCELKALDGEKGEAEFHARESDKKEEVDEVRLGDTGGTGGREEDEWIGDPLDAGIGRIVLGQRFLENKEDVAEIEEGEDEGDERGSGKRIDAVGAKTGEVLG